MRKRVNIIRFKLIYHNNYKYKGSRPFVCAKPEALYAHQWQMCRFIGFTLVELLVVISIIALLLAILMPSLIRARNQAQTMVCGSNYKQISTAIQMYANGNSEKLPVYTYPGGSELTATWEAIGLLPPLNSYISVTSKVWDCPADRDRAINRWWSDNPYDMLTGYKNHNVLFRTRADGSCLSAPFPPYDTNYGANPYLFSPNLFYCGLYMKDNRYNKPIKLTSVRRQAAVWTLFHYSWPMSPHFGVDVFAYLDGHVDKERVPGSNNDIPARNHWWMNVFTQQGKQIF